MLRKRRSSQSWGLINQVIISLTLCNTEVSLRLFHNTNNKAKDTVRLGKRRLKLRSAIKHLKPLRGIFTYTCSM